MARSESSTGEQFADFEAPFEEVRGIHERIFIDDGMDPIAHPATLTAENFQEIFGQGLPEGLDPEIFDNGGSLSLAE